MGWREREYARFTREERERFYGADAVPRRSSARATCTSGAAAAVAVSGLLFLLGHVPSGHPVVPALHFRVPGVARASSSSPHAPRHRGLPLRLPAFGAVSSSLTINGRAPGYGGRLVLVEGRWNRAGWTTLATARIGRGGAYRARFRLTRPGTLRVRLTYPDGTTSVGAMHVR